MKKVRIAIILMLIISLLCGCSNQKSDVQDEKSDLPVLVVDCDDYSPFSYTDANGEMTGIDVELAKEAFSRMGYTAKFEDADKCFEAGMNAHVSKPLDMQRLQSILIELCRKN